MKTRILLFIAILLNHFAWSQDIPDAPNPPRLVNDFVGGLMSDADKARLEQKLDAYNDSTSTQILVVIVKSVQPYEIGDYALQLGRKWGVGQKGKNNGIIILWAPGDRKITIQTGYGMEGVLPDMITGDIIRNIMGPNFKNLQYYQGLDQATDAIIKRASGEYQADPQTDDGSGLWTFLLILALIILFVYLANRGNRGGGGGGGLRGGSIWPYTTMTGWGSQSGNWGGGGSWGGGGGGGFGGFGGGSFGGGGSSGSY